MLMSSSKLFPFCERRSLKFRCKTVIGIVLCQSNQACYVLYYLCEISTRIHIYLFTFECVHFNFTICAKLALGFTFTCLPLNVYTSISGCDCGWGCGFGFEQKLWWINGFGEKKCTDRRFAYPDSPPAWKEYLNSLTCRDNQPF